MKRKIAITVLVIIGLAFIIGSTIILHKSGGWGIVAFFWVLMVGIFLTAGAIVWCINQIQS
jgi:hypothetical protein